MARHRRQCNRARLREGEDPAVNALSIPVLPKALPNNYEGPVRSEGYLRHGLIVDNVFIEPDFRPIRCAVRMVRSAPDVPRAIRWSALLPDHHEVAGSIGCHLLQAAEPNL